MIKVSCAVFFFYHEEGARRCFWKGSGEEKESGDKKGSDDNKESGDNKGKSEKLTLDLGLDIVDSVGRLHLKGDGLAREGLYENLHAGWRPRQRDSRCRPKS
jgi:hypothetical protein